MIFFCLSLQPSEQHTCGPLDSLSFFDYCLSVSPTLPSLSLPCHHLIKRAFLLLGNRCVNLCVSVFAFVCVCLTQSHF